MNHPENVRCDQCGKPLPEPTERPAVFQMEDATFCSMTCLEAHKHNQKGKPMTRPENVRCETCVFWGKHYPEDTDSVCHLEPTPASGTSHPHHWCGQHRTTWPPNRDFVRVDLENVAPDTDAKEPPITVQQVTHWMDTAAQYARNAEYYRGLVEKLTPGAVAPPGAFVVVLGDHGREWYRVEDGHLVKCGRPTWATA